jgi:hypothetical protein
LLFADCAVATAHGIEDLVEVVGRLRRSAIVYGDAGQKIYVSPSTAVGCHVLLVNTIDSESGSEPSEPG